MAKRTRAGAHAAALIGMAVSLAVVAAQDRRPVAPRHAAATSTVTAIDHGLRTAGQPRPVRTAADSYIPSRIGTSPRYVPGSVIVKFRTGTPPARQAAVLSLVRGRAAARLPHAAFDIVAVDEGANPEAVAARLAAQPDVQYAQARYRVRPLFRPNDPLYGLQWNYPAIDMERAWDINAGASSDVIVAVLDTGLAYTNTAIDFTQTTPQVIDGVSYPALGTVRLSFAAAPELGGVDRFVSPYDFIWDDPTPVDLDGHGTHVAGTIAQLTNNATGVAGMAFNVRLMPVKVVDSFWDAYFGSPFIGTDDVVARGIRYAADAGANVINLSIGRTGSPAPVLEDAVSYAVSRGAFVVIAGGNEFFDGNPIERFAEIAPRVNGAVSVAAVGRDRQRAGYSSTGSYIELAAPGGDFLRGGVQSMILQQTYNFELTDTFIGGFVTPRFDVFEYVFFEGTSMATAHVSGLAALMFEQGITRPAAIEAAMKVFATDLGPAGRDDQYGHGLINGRASLRGMGLRR